MGLCALEGQAVVISPKVWPKKTTVFHQRHPGPFLLLLVERLPVRRRLCLQLMSLAS
jgi:hypothetical protein